MLPMCWHFAWEHGTAQNNRWLTQSFCYRQLRDLSAGTHGFVQLAQDLVTGERVAIKFIERGEKVRSSASRGSCHGLAQLWGWSGVYSCCPQISKYVVREILNHKRLVHPHIVELKEVRRTRRLAAHSARHE